jgi:hypothetical protein
MEKFFVTTKYDNKIFEVYRMGEKYYKLGNDDYTFYDEDELIFITDKPYWDNLRHQYIGQFTAAMLSNPKIIDELIEHHVLDDKHQIIADLAIEQTNVLINKLKGER